MKTSLPSSPSATHVEAWAYRAAVRESPRVKKVMLEQRPGPASGDLVTANLVAVIVGTACLLFFAGFFALIVMYAMVSGFVKANNRGHRKSW